MYHNSRNLFKNSKIGRYITAKTVESTAIIENIYALNLAYFPCISIEKVVDLY